MASLEEWATDQLGVFLGALGFDAEAIQMHILPDLARLDTPEALMNHLTDLLGTDPSALGFIKEYSRRRFPPKSARSSPRPSAPKVQTPPLPPSAPPQQPQQHVPSSSSNVFPSLPANANANTNHWPANINVYMKNKTEGDYVSSQKGKKQKSTTASTSAIAQNDQNEKQQQDQQKKKKKKNEMTLETALKELDIQTSTDSKRRPCQCQATKHPLLTVAPNCLNCGKIICTQEGTGPCTFCGTPVLSKEQQVALIAEAKRKRSEAKVQQNQQQQPRRAKAAPTPSVGYAAKAGGGFSYHTEIVDDQEEEERRKRAEAHKEKLLEYQRTSAKRTTVIDQATDFILPSDMSNPWLSPQERALQMKQQQANLKKLQNQGAAAKRRVMTLDIGSRQVTMQDHVSSESESEEEPQEIKAPTPARASADDGSAGTYANNPLLKGIHAPKFMGEHQREGKGGRRRRIQRVQYDQDDAEDDHELQFASRIADDKDVTFEPVSCG
ncbi:putative zinc finger motif, C2HC5-type-domain-containing protein [Syncephalastrum racemosum]|uniref:Putative zinc finger motif, C2HC5-type-domain-containing protein n=1 Tax=Syncephalastrum racemosum TaxID=13706 RepID=A0A1X2HJT4_SYNRA|nr:putative zinc finger motif, C2HC5-type-domain-containing protein [Syncephalastrum racemosum]